MKNTGESLLEPRLDCHVMALGEQQSDKGNPMQAPIVIFVYNRDKHTAQTIQALAENDLAHKSDLVVFSDGAKSEIAAESVARVRAYVRSIMSSDLFGSVRMVEAKENQGLAMSVIGGVSSVLAQYGRAIVVEDDVIVSPLFLDFMNQALDEYEHDTRVGWIGGYTVPIEFPSDYRQDVFLSGRGSSCAWAIWQDRWNAIDWDTKDYRRFKYNPILRARFNSWGNDRAAMLDNQMLGRIDSWAIRLAYHMFMRRLYAVLPRVSLARNIGFDATGTHSGMTSKYDPVTVNREKHVRFEQVQLEKAIAAAYRRMHRVNPLIGAGVYIKRVLLRLA